MIHQTKTGYFTPLFFLLFVILILKFFFVFAFIQSEIIGLGPDEAQYWTWSQALDWGYYSKPPGIAWQIWIGTKLFGNTELGIRFFSICLNFLLSLTVYGLARVCQLKDNTAFWAAVCLAFSPLGFAGSFLATTDGGLTLFWTLSCLVMAYSINSPNYLLLGLTILGGALFKWPIYYLWIFVLGGVLWIPAWRKKTLIVGIAISFLGLLPSLFWNSTHDWATFKHVLATIQGGSSQDSISQIAQSNFWEFLGAQILLVSPIFFILMIIAFAKSIKNYSNEPKGILFCSVVSFLFLTIFSLLACFQKIQGNWCVFLYPTAFVPLAWYVCESTSENVQRRKKWLWGGLALSFVFSFAAVVLPTLEILPYKSNPLKHNLGWKTLQEKLKNVGYNPQKHFLFSDKYQTVGILSFYAAEQKRAYFFNLQQTRKNQFSYWLPPKKGMDGFFVVVENTPYLQLLEISQEKYLKEIAPYFAKVEFIGMETLITQDEKGVKAALIYKGIHYNGKLPEETEKY